MNYRTIVLMFILACVIGGCIPSRERPQDILFATLVPIEDMNKSIKLGLDPAFPNPLKIGSDINLSITNVSNDYIWFPVDSNVRIYQFMDQDNTWLEIKNAVKYSGNDYILAPKWDIKGMDSVYALVKPVIENKDEEVDIRITITGEITENGKPTGRKVAAYVDLTLKP